jgi:hypothetical protein
MSYHKTMGRLTVKVSENGATMHDYGHGCTVACLAGWNDSCPLVEHTMSVEELRDLRYLLDRAIAAADEARTRRRQ